VAKSRTKDLAVAVTQAFEAAGFTPADLLQGPIALTDLAWQTPPLRTSATLAGLPFRGYIDYPLTLDEEAFISFYSETLYSLHEAPGGVCTGLGYRRFGNVFSGAVPVGERLLRLPVPQGWPSELEPTTGHLFAAECAHLAATSLGCKAVVEDDSNFYVELPSGETMGIVAGFPSLYGDLWDSDLSGAVSLLLQQGRGQTSNSCMYDVLAKVRSALYENMEKFTEFEGLDHALQSLRILSHGRLCSELLSSIEGMKIASFKNKRRITIIAECLEVMQSWRMTDPYRIVTTLQPQTEAKIIHRLKTLRKRYGGEDEHSA
jgi:hypothetical protein